MAEIESTEIIYRKALRLAKLNETFKLIKINNTFQLESSYFGNSISKRSARMKPNELAFIKKVKHHIMKNEIYTKFVDRYYRPNDIRYISVKKCDPGTIIENVVEIDIDQAYWQTAFSLGVINQEIYDSGSKGNVDISKTTRLIALGSLAKKVDEYHYIGNRVVKHKQIRSELTENIWYSICKTVSDAMWQARKIAKNDFYLFWVDGIYIRNNPRTIEKITNLFETYGYKVKIKESLKIEYTEMTAIVTNPSTGKSRPFFLPKKEVKRRHFTDQELKEACFQYMKHDAVKEDNLTN
jgi:hypothetical protein